VHVIRLYGLLALTALILVVSQILLKQGMRSGSPLSVANLSQLGELLWRILSSPVLLLGYALSGISALLWLLVLSRVELTYAAPLFTGMYYILLFVGSGLVLGETIGLAKGAGTMLIVAGVVLIMVYG
jgi:drug/metabolite transporter (DMT)-like permease